MDRLPRRISYKRRFSYTILQQHVDQLYLSHDNYVLHWPSPFQHASLSYGTLVQNVSSYDAPIFHFLKFFLLADKWHGHIAWMIRLYQHGGIGIGLLRNSGSGVSKKLVVMASNQHLFQATACSDKSQWKTCSGHIQPQYHARSSFERILVHR
ncbi:predicted protein [Lichtheimia corymbifera JMRC:FSU:9682]|uniref:Uncharacterized protein n=1 Tax=Lichtheimia corymbifera JMRC:FSU:9682 TaxID=1263082 RepID=A0A068RZ06_9FUNG|nr:predicted protein [Lichtheimia corymbifera JMRC:FSU:9682]